MGAEICVKIVRNKKEFFWGKMTLIITKIQNAGKLDWNLFDIPILENVENYPLGKI